MLKEVMDEWEVDDKEQFKRWGVQKWARTYNKTYASKTLRERADAMELPIDVPLQQSQTRQEMQTTAEAGHQGEPRWTHTDADFFETMSSGCAIVGFFVGYQPCPGKTGALTTSRTGQVELGLDWNMIPGLCRQDDLAEGDARLSDFRKEKAAKKAAAASSSSPAASSSRPAPGTPTLDSNPDVADYDPDT